MQRKDYEAQGMLVVQTLPFVAMEKVFALKGGTAINLFFRDFPRISVDIDLTYLPIKGRNESLAEINDTLDRISSAVENGISGAKTLMNKGGGNATRFSVFMNGIAIKVETSPTARGVVHDIAMRRISKVAE